MSQWVVLYDVESRSLLRSIFRPVFSKGCRLLFLLVARFPFTALCPAFGVIALSHTCLFVAVPIFASNACIPHLLGALAM